MPKKLNQFFDDANGRVSLTREEFAALVYTYGPEILDVPKQIDRAERRASNYGLILGAGGALLTLYLVMQAFQLLTS